MPAHNEAAGIVRSLSSIATEFEHLDASTYSGAITVLANGCTDTTAEVADDWANQYKRDASHVECRVVELEEGHKIKALNAGIARSERDMTIVMDADRLLIVLLLAAWFSC